MDEQGYWVIRTYQGGAVGEKTKFYVPGSIGRNKRETESCIRKQEQNEGNVKRRVARYMNENFSHKDYFAGFDFSEAGLEKVSRGARRLKAKSNNDKLTDEDYMLLSAGHEGELLIRRMKNRLPAGGEIKYLIFASDREKDKSSGDMRPCRVHLHIILSGCGQDAPAMRALLGKTWTLGGVSLQHLYNAPDYWGLAEYLCDQVRRIPNQKKYKPSRNLVLPKPKDRIVHSQAELRLPKGATFLRRGEYKAGEPQYLRYLLPHRNEDGDSNGG